MASTSRDPFRQAIERLGLSLERGTSDVPDDNRFHVVLRGTIVLSSSSQSEATAEYRRQRDDLLSQEGFKPAGVDPQDVLRRERMEREVNEVRGGSGVRSKLRIPGRRGHR